LGRFPEARGTHRAAGRRGAQGHRPHRAFAVARKRLQAWRQRGAQLSDCRAARMTSGGRDPRVDAYIAKAEPFAQTILTHLRALVHAHAPRAEEALKWGVPHFVLGGQNLAAMAAFRMHATFGFWRDEEVTGAARREGAMGSFGRLAS